jgi:hypothetical protein
MPLAYVHFLPDRDASGRPVDPGYGVDEGAHPGQGLPGSPGRPPRPDQGLPRPPWEGSGRPVDPGYGWGGGEHPGHLPARPGGGRPVDPGYGVDQGGSAGQLPIFPLEPGQGLPGGEHPGQGLPGGEHPGQGLPSEPGTIWPPLPGGPGFHGKAVLGCYAYYNGKMNHHFVVVTIPEVPPERPSRPTDPGYGVDEGASPGQGLPGQPGRPPQAGQLPGRPGAPPQPGQPLPRPEGPAVDPAVAGGQPPRR